ncbi:MAG: hypothetical protein ACTSO9_19275 [Candidatus Helarchaeota archaeon]
MIGSWINQEKQEITLILTNYPCSYNRCHHCPFDIESINDENEITYTNKQIIEEAKIKISEFGIKKIKIFNGGSFFELPETVFQLLNEITINKEVSIESRPEFLTKKTIIPLFRKLSPSKLNIFIGFDSVDEIIRNKILNKGIPQSEINRILALSKELIDISFFSYILFGIEGVSEESVKDSVRFFNQNMNGVSAIEFRENPKSKLKHQKVSENLRDFLTKNCSSVDFIGVDDEQWVLQ